MNPGEQHLKPYSREWFVARIGEELVADAERIALQAPEPTAAQKEMVRRIFAREEPVAAPRRGRPSLAA